MTTTTTGFDLDAYLARVGHHAEEPSLGALARLQAAHVRTHPFDNIDVLLEQHPGVTIEAVTEKFVSRGRGGYCFEHATLFHAAVTALGYDATLRLSRVGDPQAAPRTHLGVVVTFDGVRWLADPGIGVPPLGPIRLEDGARLAGGIWAHEVRRVAEGPSGPGWQLWRERSAGWELMHTTDELPVRPVDVAMGHHWTSTHPTSHFRSTFMLARHDRRGRRHPDTDHGDPGRRDRAPGRRAEHPAAPGPGGAPRPGGQPRGEPHRRRDRPARTAGGRAAGRALTRTLRVVPRSAGPGD